MPLDDDITTSDIVKVAGMGTAIGLGVRKWWQLTDFNDIVQSHKVPSNYEKAYSATQNVLANLGGMSVSRSNKYNQVGLEALIRGIKEEKFLLTGTDITSALIRAAKRQDPSGTLATQIQTRMESGLSAIDALEHVQHLSRQSNSIYLQRTISHFLTDLGTMEDRLISGKPITPTALPNMRIGKSKHIKLNQLAGRGGLVDTIRQIEERLEGRVVLRGYQRKDLPGQQLQLQIFGSPFMEPSKKGRPQLKVNIPLSLREDPNIVIHGATQQSKYITGEFWEIERLQEQWRINKKMRYEEWAANHFLETHALDIANARRVARRDVHGIEHAYYQTILRPLEWVDELPPGYHAGQDEYIRARTQIARLSGIGGQELSDLEYADVIRRGVADEEALRTVYPGASPNVMTRNVVSLVDWRQEMGVVPEAFDWARRPMQSLRREYTPTGPAAGKIARHELTQMYPWAARGTGAPSPLLRTLYVKSDLAPQLQRLGLNIEGSGLITQGVTPMFAQEELARYSVSSQNLLDLENILGDTKKSLWEFEGKIIPKGTVLGYNPEGLPEIVDEPFRLFRAARFQDKNKKDFIKLVGARDIDDMKWFKVFGDAKAMMGVTEQRRINQILELTGQQMDLPIHAIVAMDELRKNRSLHYKQMFTALHEFTRENMKKKDIRMIKGYWREHLTSREGKPFLEYRWVRGHIQKRTRKFPAVAKEFFAKPEETINKLRKLAVSGDVLQHETMLRDMATIARAAELTPEQMGGVFGAVPDVFGDEWRSIFTEPEIAAISRGTPVGLAQFSFGGRYGPGSGGLGSIEPRMFELLSSPHLGELGPELQEEVMRRMTYKYGHRLGEQETLAKSALSLLEPSGKAGVLSSLWTGEMTQAGKAVLPSLWTGEMTQAGGLLNIPNIGDVSIPSAQQMSQMAKYRTAGGVEVTPQLASEYESLISQARRYEIGEIGKTDILESMNKAREEIMRAQMLTVTGEGSLLRGRLMGSRFLTAVPPVETALQRGEVGISHSMAKQMLAEVAEVHGDDTLAKSMMKQLEAGEAIGGAVMRHPFIGPYSTAPVGVRLLRGADPRTIAIGEEFMPAKLLTETGAVAEDLGNIRLGPAVGMALDYDADIASLMLLPPDQGKRAMAAALTDEADAYAVRSQLLKAKKAAVGGVTLTEAAAGATLKLRIPKERLGLLSESLQVARAAVLREARGPSQRTMNALGFLEWLEQTPISGKHIAAGEEQQMISLFSNIREAVTTRNREKLATSAESVVGLGGIGERFLGKGGRVKLGERVLDISGINLEQATHDIMMSIGEFERKGVEGVSPARMRQIVRGRGARINPEEAASIFRFGLGGGESPFAGLIKTIDEPGTFAAASRRASSIRNKAASTTGRILEHAKPVALGFGAAVGIATMLSSPPKNMRMDAPERVKPAGTGGEHITPQNISNPEGHQMGSPTVEPPMAGVNTSPVMPNSVRINVRGRSSSGVDYSTLNSNLSRSLGGARVNSKVIDNRQSLSPEQIAKIIGEGY